MNSSLGEQKPLSFRDTAYQSEDTEKIGFLNRKYFDLMATKPTLGDRFSLLGYEPTCLLRSASSWYSLSLYSSASSDTLSAMGTCTR
jgi:hypothetical protein